MSLAKAAGAAKASGDASAGKGSVEKAVGGKAIAGGGKSVPASAPKSSVTPGQIDITTLAVPHSEPPPRRTLPPDDPPLGGVYSAPDTGKTTAFGFFLPTPNTLWLCDPGALEPIRGRCKYDPQNVDKSCRNVKDITAILPQAAELGYTSIAIDDWAGKMQASLTSYRREGRVGDSGKIDGFYPYSALNDDLMEQREAARYLGIAVFGNFWEDPPKFDPKKGKQKKGGPGIPGEKGKEIIVSLLDFLYRGGSNPTFKPWSGTYKRYPITDPNWASKDRYSLDIAEMPMNLGEIFRFAGFGLAGSPWIPERAWDWQEDVVDEIAVRMWHSANDAEIGRECATKLLDGSYPGFDGNRVEVHAVEWTLRDAVDRVRLWRLAPKTDAAAMAARFGW